VAFSPNGLVMLLRSLGLPKRGVAARVKEAGHA
jgi:hypothetical protein